MTRQGAFYHRGFLRRLTAGAPIVVVSGLPRSGTSLLMGMLQAGGMEVLTDGIRQPDEDNPRAYFEMERVKDLHKEADPGWLRAARGKAIKIVSYFLPYLPDRFDYQVLFMTRDLTEVLASQARMLERRGERHDVDLTASAEEHLRATRRLLNAPRFSSLDVPYSAVVADPSGEAARIAGFLAPRHRLDVARMAAVVDPKLYRNRSAASGVID